MVCIQAKGKLVLQAFTTSFTTVSSQTEKNTTMFAALFYREKKNPILF